MENNNFNSAVIDGVKYLLKAGTPRYNVQNGIDTNKAEIIVKAIEAEIGVSCKMLNKRKYFFYRASCVYLLRLYVSESTYEYIGGLLGYKEHSAVLYAAGAAGNLIETEYDKFCEVYTMLYNAVRVALLRNSYTLQEHPDRIPPYKPSGGKVAFTISEVAKAGTNQKVIKLPVADTAVDYRQRLLYQIIAKVLGTTTVICDGDAIHFTGTAEQEKQIEDLLSQCVGEFDTVMDGMVNAYFRRSGLSIEADAVIKVND